MKNKAYETKLLPLSEEAIALAAKLLKAGELVAIPTETVYGLAANALDASAVAKIFETKGRPQDNPLIVHISDRSMWEQLVTGVSEDAKLLADAFWPGPLSIILPKSDAVPLATTAGLSSVAVRMPEHPAARAVIEASGLPLAAPSANISGSPSPTSAAHCADDLWGKVPLILDGGACSVGIESTVVSLEAEPTVLRPGKITAAELGAVLGRPVIIAKAVEQPLLAGEQPLSPGMKYRHYAPNAKVILMDGTLDTFIKELEHSPEGTYGLVFEGEEQQCRRPCVAYGREHDADSQSQGIFRALRTLDELGAMIVYARCPDRDNAALGVYNRMLRAAGFEVRRL